MMFHLDQDYSPDAFEVKVSELLVATVDHTDALIDSSVPEVLHLLREHLKMDVVFVSEFIEGRRYFRHVDAAPDRQIVEVGHSDPLELTWCQRVVDGRMPLVMPDVVNDPRAAGLPSPRCPVGAFISTPIVLSDGHVYGTLCAFSFNAVPELQEKDLRKLELSAQLTARRIEAGQAQQREHDVESIRLEPMAPPRRHRH